MPIDDGDGPPVASFDITVDAATVGGDAHPRGSSAHVATGRPGLRVIVAALAGFAALLVAAALLLAMPRTEPTEESSLPRAAARATDAVATTAPAATPTLTTSPTGTEPVTSPATMAPTVPVAFVPWPAPPKDHDPTVTGRPLSLPPDLSPGHTLMYVNDLGRPTLLDLTSGDRYEVEIAETRLEDVFLVEHGHVVTQRPGQSTLRPASGRAIAVSIHRAGRDPAAELQTVPVPGPQLCLGADGCPELRWRTGSFGTEDDHIESIDSTDAVAAIGAMLGASSWESGPRWTLYRFADVGGESRVPTAFQGKNESRVPTPLQGTTVWVVTQTVPAR